MRRPAVPREDQFLRLGSFAVGVLLMASAWLAGDLARAHMAAIGSICGAGPDPHCGWCFGTASLALAGLAAFVFALRGPRAAAAPAGPALEGA